MPTTDPIEILLAHNSWAIRQLLDTCATLTNDQFHRRFEMGPGSLHDTATHMITAMRIWTDVLAQREVRPRLEGAQHTVSELIALLDEAATDLTKQAKSGPLDGRVQRTRDGKTFEFSRSAVLMQVTTHGVHHRAQCLNMLRQIGVTPLPKSSVIEWILIGSRI